MMKSRDQNPRKCSHAKVRTGYVIALPRTRSLQGMGKASHILYHTLIIGAPEVYITQLGAQLRVPLGTQGHLSE